MIDKIRNFFSNRYGIDGLNRFLLILGLLLSLINIFIDRPIINRLLVFFANISLIILIVRAFSRDYNSRYQENIKFFKLIKPLRKEIDVLRLRWRDRKTHRYVRCRSCNNHLRVPKNLGKIKITCNHCGNVFYKRV